MDFTSKVQHRDIEYMSYRGLELDVTNTGTGKPQKHFISDDDEIHFSDFTVQWTLDIEAREWGIKGLSISSTKVSGSMFIGEVDEKGDEINEYEFVLPETFKIETKNSECRKLNDDITTQSIEIDMKNKLITILF